MTQEELQKAIREVDATVQQPIDQNRQADPMDEFIRVLFALRSFKRHRTTAPTHKPRTFIEQVELYDDATNRRLYLYINGTWRYVALT